MSWIEVPLEVDPESGLPVHDRAGRDAAHITKRLLARPEAVNPIAAVDNRESRAV